MEGNTKRWGTSETGNVMIATEIRGDASINITLTIAAAVSPILILTAVTMAGNREIGKEKKDGIGIETQTEEERVRTAGKTITVSRAYLLVGTGTPREVVVEGETAGIAGIVGTNRTIEIVEIAGVVRAL